MTTRVPQGMTRRHFLSHMAGASALTAPALTLGHTLNVHAQDLKKRRKSAILLWMGGGPSTMDIWDLKPGAPTGGISGSWARLAHSSRLASVRNTHSCGIAL